MTDERQGTFCPIHDQEFMACPCPDRRTTTTHVEQIVVCVKCNRHCSRCVCEEPEMEIRVSA